MSDEPLNVREQLWRISDALTESWENADENEIKEDLLLGGPAALESAEELRRALLATERQWRKDQLTRAREGHGRSVAELAAASARLPAGLGNRRELLFGLMANRPELQPALTVQFRDFSALTDDDVESILRQLVALGIDIGKI